MGVNLGERGPARHSACSTTGRVIDLFSQTTEYALRAMASLAYSADELTPTPELAKITKVPMNYLAKVLQSLAQADLIVGRRGVGGGYKLAKPPTEISLLDVINAINPVERITSCPLGLENHGTRLCPLHARMDRAAKDVIEYFGGVMLIDLITAPGENRPLCDSAMTERVEMTIQRD